MTIDDQPIYQPYFEDKKAWQKSNVMSIRLYKSFSNKLQENIINVVLRTNILYLRQELSVMCWTIIKTQMFRGAWGKSNSDISDSFYFSDILIEVCAQKRVTFFTSDRPARFVIMIWFTEWYVAMAWWIWSEAENNTYGKKVAISLESSSFSVLKVSYSGVVRSTAASTLSLYC